MISKKIKIIILIVIILFLLVGIFFTWQFFNKKSKYQTIEELPSILKELKENNPKFSLKQIEYYEKTAERNEKIMEPCLKRKDKEDCMISVAYIKSDKSLCYSIDGKRN